MASLTHKSSCESIKEELDLFSVPLIQTSLEKGSYVEYHPVAMLPSTGPTEFVVPGESSSYIEFLNTLLHVCARIKK